MSLGFRTTPFVLPPKPMLPENTEIIHWRPIAEAKKDGTWCFTWPNLVFAQYIDGQWEDGHSVEAEPTHFAEVKGPRS